MKAFVRFLLAVAVAVPVQSVAQDTLWVQSSSRFDEPSLLDLSDADSVVFTTSSLRVWSGGKGAVKSYTTFLKMMASADSSAALTFDKPGRIIWKPITSDNQYNNDYYREGNKWTFANSKESEHFIVFWDKAFGSNPNAASVKSSLRVDVDDLLRKAEKFYDTNVNRLGMASVGQGQSQLDTYKMSIYLLYDEGWTAVGSGYDDVIGALWVTPSTCHPVGSTIAHEIGHSFQYQVASDYRKNGKADYLHYGWRYGYGANGEGGNAFWEQCAQWQSFQDYPSETFGYHTSVWLQNYHRHFCHEWMRYASYWLQYAWTERHGYEAYGRLWRESAYPEDPIESYVRLFCGGDLSRFWDEYWTDYASRLPNYQFRDVHRYATAGARDFNVSMNRTEDGYWQVAYGSCPETSGVNIIQLNVPAAGTQVQADFAGLNPGAALLAADPGKSWNGDPADGANADKYTVVTTYNAAGRAANRGWRYGFVAVKDDQTLTSDLFRDAEGTATYTVPEGTDRLYFVVVGAPKVYNRHTWDETDGNDEQWPYKVRFDGTNRVGVYDFDSNAAPVDTVVTYAVAGDGTSQDWLLGSVNLLQAGLMEAVCKAFKLQPADIAAATLPVSVNTVATPQEGKISFAMKAPTTNVYSYAYTANAGFWCSAAGAAQAYGSAPVYVEYAPSTFVLSYGHMPGTGKGKTYVLRPSFVYKKDGHLYHAVIELTLNY